MAVRNDEKRALQKLEISGRVDINRARALHLQALAVYDQPGDVLLEWSAVDSLDAAGLQILLALHAALRTAGRRLDVTPPSEAVARTLALAGVSGTFTGETTPS